MTIGETISWMTVNGPKTGVVERSDGERHLVRLENKKAVIVDFSSVLKVVNTR